MTPPDISYTSKDIQDQSAKGFSGLLYNSKLMEEAYKNSLEEHRNWVGVKDGFPGEETAIHGEDKGMRGSKAEQQQTELDKHKVREMSRPLLENRT